MDFIICFQPTRVGELNRFKIKKKTSGIVSTLIKQISIIGSASFFASCATSMTPIEVYKTLPALTKSNFMSQAQTEDAIKAKTCKYLVTGREYAAPKGLTVNADLKNGAKGIDEWVMLDGGNACVLTSYKWVTVNDEDDTQLHLEFNTMLCE
jgi:hypothetical protein